MLKGTIIRIISNLYTVKTNKEIYQCRSRGKFRHLNLTPLVGDRVLIDQNDKYIMEILPRKNSMVRPMIANVDCALIMTSVKEPDLSLNLLDKLICNITINEIEPIICFSKIDLLNEEEFEPFQKIIDYYNDIGIVSFINTDKKNIMKYLENKIVVLTGQTGAGKSTFLNLLDKKLNLETKPISKALGRGVHTTRHTELHEINNVIFSDTPGFSALELSQYTKEDIKFSFIEFNSEKCKYRDCNHINEDKCGIKEAVDNGKILISRYENYLSFMKEGKNS